MSRDDLPHAVIDYVRTRCHGRHAHMLSCPTWCSRLGEGESASRVFSDTHSHALDLSQMSETHVERV